jgi:uncharacterized membrane protein YbhN (UPF0104 family)
MQSWQNPAFWLVFILLPFNWGMEARKWQLLMRPLERLSFITAFKSVLAGCSVTMLTPNRIGEYGGRIIYVKEENRLDAIPLTILGSVSQLFVTLLMGTVGLAILKYYKGDQQIFQFLPAYAGDVLFFLSIGASAFFLLIYFRAGLIVKLLGRIKRLKKFVDHIILLKTFSRKQLLRILSLSFFRYMVFILQYILLLRVMHVEIGFVMCFWLLTIFYLIMAMAPTIGFTELPVRAAAIVEILQPFDSNILGMQAAALGIWLINLVVPAVAGSILFLGIKIMKEK